MSDHLPATTTRRGFLTVLGAGLAAVTLLGRPVYAATRLVPDDLDANRLDPLVEIPYVQSFWRFRPHGGRMLKPTGILAEYLERESLGYGIKPWVAFDSPTMWITPARPGSFYVRHSVLQTLTEERMEEMVEAVINMTWQDLGEDYPEIVSVDRATPFPPEQMKLLQDAHTELADCDQIGQGATLDLPDNLTKDLIQDLRAQK